jgi:hypothetical protein
MAYLVIELNLPSLAISTLNDKALNAGDKSDVINQCVNVLMALAAGAEGGSIQATSRDSTAAVATSGANSKQVIY